MVTKAKGGSVSVAQKLIESTRAKARRVALLTPLGVEHLQELCDYNDGVQGMSGRVSKVAAAESLATFGWKGGREALDAVCREQLGRESFARKGGGK